MNFSPVSGFLSAPDRGSFPLDHDGKCKAAMKDYMACIREERFQTRKCQKAAKEYLQCRMDRGLMARDDFANLGLGHIGDAESKKPRQREEAALKQS